MVDEVEYMERKSQAVIDTQHIVGELLIFYANGVMGKNLERFLVDNKLCIAVEGGN